ncbi:MAG TPA: Holliday junction resolvase RuvX [Patescibacteria group bacterium]|nr:Holliday junction resolvase RuvX [Patescibacteria group bacterium]
MKYLAIDWGEKRIGVAVGNDEPKLAMPLSIASSYSELLEIIAEEEPDKVILGNPISMSGQASLSKNFNGFKNKLASDINHDLILVDERLSSISADKLAGKRIKATRDSVSAMIILESYLETI